MDSSGPASIFNPVMDFSFSGTGLVTLTQFAGRFSGGGFISVDAPRKIEDMSFYYGNYMIDKHRRESYQNFALIRIGPVDYGFEDGQAEVSFVIRGHPNFFRDDKDFQKWYKEQVEDTR
jgi:hypothetical protein